MAIPSGVNRANLTQNAPTRPAEHGEVTDVTDVVDLRAENTRLRAEVERLRNPEGVIHLDTQTQRLRIRALDTPILKCDHLDVQVAGGREAIDRLCTPRALAGKLNLDDLRRYPLTVYNACIRVPQEAVSTLAQSMAGPRLAREGVRIDRVSFADGNRIVVEGSVKKLISLSFTASARVSCAGDHAVSIDLDEARIAGLIPVTGLITSLLDGMSAGRRNRLNIKVDGNRITLDASACIPSNIKARLTHIGTDNGHLVVKAESPEKSSRGNS